MGYSESCSQENYNVIRNKRLAENNVDRINNFFLKHSKVKYVFLKGFLGNP